MNSGGSPLCPGAANPQPLFFPGTASYCRNSGTGAEHGSSLGPHSSQLRRGFMCSAPASAQIRDPLLLLISQQPRSLPPREEPCGAARPWPSPGVSILGAPNERRECRRLSRKAGQPSHPPTGVDGAPKSPFGCSVFKDRGPWHFCGTEKRYPLPHHILLKIGFWAGEWGSSSGSPAPPVAPFGPSGGWAQIPSPAPPCTA